MTERSPALTIAGLEDVYDSIAAALDAAGEDKAVVLLVKLALLNANAIGDPRVLQEHLQIALRDLQE